MEKGTVGEVETGAGERGEGGRGEEGRGGEVEESDIERASSEGGGMTWERIKSWSSGTKVESTKER